MSEDSQTVFALVWQHARLGAQLALHFGEYGARLHWTNRLAKPYFRGGEDRRATLTYGEPLLTSVVAVADQSEQHVQAVVDALREAGQPLATSELRRAIRGMNSGARVAAIAAAESQGQIRRWKVGRGTMNGLP